VIGIVGVLEISQVTCNAARVSQFVIATRMTLAALERYVRSRQRPASRRVIELG
jgi:hypothetical protein